MDLLVTAQAESPPSVAFPWLEDLTRYPQWLSIVQRVTPSPEVHGDRGPAWWVDLRGRLGPFARSKRLRMVRVHHLAPHEVIFERSELDGKQHSAWCLAATVADRGTGSALELRLQYDGSLFGSVLERLLSDEVARARPALVALIDG